MYVKQISVFIENAPGKLADFTRMLGEKGIDLMSLSIADTTSFGILRFIVADWERAVKLIEEAGYAVSLTDVLAVEVPDRPGGLADMLLVKKGLSPMGLAPMDFYDIREKQLDELADAVRAGVDIPAIYKSLT